MKFFSKVKCNFLFILNGNKGSQRLNFMGDKHERT